MDAGFEVPFPSSLFAEFGTTFVATVGQSFSVGFEAQPLSEFGSTFVAVGAKSFSPGFQASILSEFGITFAGRGGPPTQAMLPGFEMAMSSRLWFPTDTAFEILPGPVIISPFPGNRAMTEIIWPIVPVSEVNKTVFALDSEEWKASQKAATVVPRTISTVRFRVDTSYLATFLADLDTKRASQFRLITLGYCPFGGSSEDNYVRVITRSRPQREERGLTQLVDVTFRFMATYP